MTRDAREQYAEAVRPRYQIASKADRGRMLDEYCRITACHRKSAIRALGREIGAARRRSGRPRRYGGDLEPVLERLWVASDGLSGKLLVAVLPALLGALERYHGLRVRPAIRRALTSASAATLDRLLRPVRRPAGAATTAGGAGPRFPARASPCAHVGRLGGRDPGCPPRRSRLALRRPSPTARISLPWWPST